MTLLPAVVDALAPLPVIAGGGMGLTLGGATGAAEFDNAATAHDLGFADVAFDAVDKEAIRARHRRAVDAALAAVAVSLARGSRQIQTVAEGEWFERADGKPLFSVTFEMRAEASIAAPLDDETALRAQQLMALLASAGELRMVCHLLVRSLTGTQDRLRAFIFAWSALEILVGKLTSGFESGEWQIESARAPSRARKQVGGKDQETRTSTVQFHGSYDSAHSWAGCPGSRTTAAASSILLGEVA